MPGEGIAVWWIGAAEPNDRLLDEVVMVLARETALTVHRHRVRSHPVHTFDPARGQHSSTAILRWLAERVPAGTRKLLALTDVDLFIPVLTFVYGEAVLNGSVAVVSTARMGAGDPRLLVPRVVKTCVHEIGHTFGLVHCDHDRCVMRRSTSVAGLDAKGVSFCMDCRVRFRDAADWQELAP